MGQAAVGNCHLTLNTNGGFVRYQSAIEPALAMLAFRRDSWVFQNASVIDILTELLTDYQGKV